MPAPLNIPRWKLSYIRRAHLLRRRVMVKAVAIRLGLKPDQVEKIQEALANGTRKLR